MPFVANRGGGRRHFAVTKRRPRRIAAVAAVLVACSVALSLWIVVQVSDARSRAVASVLLLPRHPQGHTTRPAMISFATTLAACEARIEHGPHTAPTVAIVGASYTAGIGPDNPEQSWAVALARQLHWNAVIYGVPGVGYVRTGATGRGPIAHMLTQESLRALDPALVIVQAGHDDAGMPAWLERRRVAAAVHLIHTAAPAARIALLTTFAVSLDGSPALRQTDADIVSAGTAADPDVIIMDPLAGRWTFPRAGDGLHPTAAGDAWIARAAAAILLAHGVRPAPATSTAPVICDVSVGVGKPVSATA
jgi:lysophospholipase L1-like esterase